MPGGRRVTKEEGQKQSFAKRRDERKKVGPVEKDRVPLKVSFLIPALLFNAVYLSLSASLTINSLRCEQPFTVFIELI